MTIVDSVSLSLFIRDRQTEKKEILLQAGNARKVNITFLRRDGNVFAKI
jgi:hypothetical protein